MARVIQTFTVDPEKDADILAWLEDARPRRKSEQIREALRAFIDSGGGVERRLTELEYRVELLETWPETHTHQPHHLGDTPEEGS